MNTDGIHIGIDGGGTQTRALAIDTTGKVVGSARGDSTNQNHFAPDVVEHRLHNVIRQAVQGRGDSPDSLGRVRSIVCGMSAVSTDHDAAIIAESVRSLSSLPRDVKVKVVNDAVVGLAGGLSGRAGVLLIAGTGSACLGVGRDGQSVWCGGWGAEADDVGSAYWLALEAFTAALRSHDGRAQKTRLLDEMLCFLDIVEPRLFLDRTSNGKLSRNEAARFAPRVLQAAREGDQVALGILDQGATELALLVHTVGRQLFSGEDRFEVVLVGGAARSGRPYQTLIVDRIQRSAPAARVVEPDFSPVGGAALQALLLCGVEISQAVLNCLASFPQARS